MTCNSYMGICLLNVAYKILAKIIQQRLLKYAEVLVGEYQCGFRPGRATSDHMFSIRQLIEKCYEFNIDHTHLFIDFKQAYDSIYRPSMWQIMHDFGIPKKLIKMTQVCMEGSKCKVKIGNRISDAFETKSGLRQGCTLSPLLFNLVMEKVTRVIINMQEGLKVGNSKINDLSYADDVDLIVETAGDVDILATNLKEMAGKVGLEINENKIKLLKLTKGDDMRGAKLPKAGMDIEYVQQFKYLGSIITSKNEIKTEVEARINAANKCYYSILNILKKRSIS